MSTSNARIRFTIAVRDYQRAMQRAATAAHLFSLAVSRKRHVPRCRLCSPTANPAPLSIDGRSYRARTRSRRGRR